ncbi:uncharacterized protein TrAFT101_001241 [Trichoderma asperellum]|uniref:uncharacterized protein n=1 Tax=Trichoderma asperellum TaxID=101201 RepID=UPI00332390F4|nr:hypothetical protein TrAFT101_001241 [Trichoderma asperellum]
MLRGHQALSPLSVEEVWGGPVSSAPACKYYRHLLLFSPSRRVELAGMLLRLILPKSQLGAEATPRKRCLSQGGVCMYMVHDAAFKLPGSQISGQAKARRAQSCHIR